MIHVHTMDTFVQSVTIAQCAIATDCTLLNQMVMQHTTAFCKGFTFQFQNYTELKSYKYSYFQRRVVGRWRG